MSNDSAYVTISQEAQALLGRLADPAAVGAAMCRAMDKQNELTIGYIQRTKLSSRGPMTLGVVTNRLRSSIRPSQAVFDGVAIRSGIGSNVSYAAAHEFGFADTVTVKAHQRRAPQGDRFLVGQIKSGLGGMDKENYTAGVTGQEVSRITALRMGLLTKTQAGKRAAASGKYTFAQKKTSVQTASGVSQVKAHPMKMNVKARHYVFNGIKERINDYGAALSQAVVNFFTGK